MDESKLKDDLLAFTKEKAVIRGERTLASGQKSDFYIDGKQVSLHPQGIFLLSKVILSMLHGVNADAIGGPTLGADPIASAVSLLSSQSGHPVKACIVRKAAKDHGMQKTIEGPALQEGDRVVVVEDVVTTGGSVLSAIREIEKTGARVVKVICLVDRRQGGAETLGPYQFTPIFTIDDLGLT